MITEPAIPQPIRPANAMKPQAMTARTATAVAIGPVNLPVTRFFVEEVVLTPQRSG